MSVVSVNEIARARSTELELDGTRKHSRAFLVITNDRDDGSVTAITAAGTASRLEQHPDDDRAYCVRKTTAAGGDEKDGKRWIVKCEYSTLTRQQKRRLQHPLDRPADIKYGFARFQGPLLRDSVTGQAVTNSALMYPDPPPTRDQNRRVIILDINKDTDRSLLLEDYMDAVNEDVFLGRAPDTVKITEASSQLVHEEFGTDGSEQQIEYWAEHLEFEVNKEDWKFKLLDQGRYTMDFDEFGVFWEPVRDKGELSTTEPRLLDGTGLELDTTLPGWQAVEIPYNQYKRRNFSALNL